MRIVIDMQGAQTESRFRGIGRYSLSLAQAIVRNRGQHEIILALNGLLPDTIEPIRGAFHGLLPQANIRVWYAPGPVREVDPSNSLRRDIAELVRESFITSLRPNVVLVTSLFEGLGDDAVMSVGCFDVDTPIAVVLYDLIPLISPDIHFRKNPVHIDYYRRKIDSLKCSAALLAISESSRREALEALQFSPDMVTNISSGCDPRFHRIDTTDNERQDLCSKFAISKPFLMYTGGADERKNLHRLIQAFAELPRDMREHYQLVMVGKMPEGQVLDFRATAKKEGLNSSQLVFTGYVSDLELMRLYGMCQLFVFPSLHEGFGLPPLEAMACGAPVITANVTSLPEVVGREDAMFDPLSTRAISEKIMRVLTDEAFRQDLIRYGAERVTSFSWDHCAKTAIAALEKIAKPSRVSGFVDGVSLVKAVDTGLFKPVDKRILVSKLDHMGDLVLAIPAIMKLRARYPYARIDALVGSWNVEAAQMLDVFAHIYVLDFFSKKSSESATALDNELDSLTKQLKEYDLAIDLRRQRDTRFILLKVPARMHVGYSTGDDNMDRRMDVCLPAAPDVPFVTTELNRTPTTLQMLHLVDALPADVNDYIRLPQLVSHRSDGRGRVAIFPKAGSEVKEWGDHNFQVLIRLLAEEPKVYAISVYTLSPSDTVKYEGLAGDKLQVFQGLPYAELIDSLSGHALCVANNSFGAHLASLLGVQVVGVYAGHEVVAEWAPVFGDARVIYTPIECSPCHIARREDCKHEFKCLRHITPNYVHKVVLNTLDGLALPNDRSIEDVVFDLLHAVAPKATTLSQPDQLWLASCAARSIQVQRRAQLFVDISTLVLVDAKTGIQRVVRSILKYLLEQTDTNYEVVPVYALMNQTGYFHARQFSSRFREKEAVGEVADDLIDYQSGDFFLGLDLQPHVIPVQRDYLSAMRDHGVRVLFVLYDILWTKMPDYFEPGAAQDLARWLEVIEGDGVICISRSVANELVDWLEDKQSPRERPFAVSWFHLGADLQNSQPTKGIPADVDFVLREADARPTFLMVGTLEPRKAHAHVLDAFQLLWAGNHDVNLVIVGKQGWNVDDLCNRVRMHPECGQRLIWLEAISDEYLEKIYALADCLIVASEGEGFGLPLIEAAHHKLPIIARDLPVFREVAGDYAFYFTANTARELATEIEEWMRLFAKGEAPQSLGMPYLTWKQSAQQLLCQILESNGTAPISGLRVD
jgi:glycosyltransferase involved in cell wall biosynthesis/ADP-heptose:LPS heptosyltransferase